MNRHMLAAATLALLPAAANAQNTAPVKIDVQSAVECIRTGITDFGPVGTQGGTYTIDPVAPTGAQLTAVFDCTGAAGATITVSWEPVDLCHETLGCGTKLVFTPNVSHYEDNYQPYSTVIASEGSAPFNGVGHHYFWLGGQVPVNPSQAPGMYSGIFTLVVEYQ